MTVLEVSEDTFQADVLDRSHEVPVVVDFYADWCGPCKVLGPVLERMAEAAQGCWILAKVNTDANPGLSQRFGIRGIPAVKGIVNGKVVSEFTGVKQEPQIAEWLQTLGPSESDKAVEAATAALAAGDRDTAKQHLAYALSHDKDHDDAVLQSLRLFAQEGDAASMDALIARLSPAANDRLQGAIVPLRYAVHVQAWGGRDAIVAAHSASPDAPEANYNLALLEASDGELEAALRRLLGLVRTNRSYGDDAARKAMLGLFATLGETDPLVKTWRRKLAMALF